MLYNVLQIVVLDKDIDLMKNALGILVNIRGTEYTVGLWFLPLLFIVDVIVVLLTNLRFCIQILAVIGVSTFGFMYAALIGIVLPWGIDAALVVTLFVYAGYALKDRIIETVHLVNCKRRIVILLAIVALILNISFNVMNMVSLSECVDMYFMRYGNPFLYIVSAFFGICFVVLCCSLYSDDKGNKLLSYIGQNTIHIYCIHGLILAVLKKINEYLCMQNLVGIVITDLIMATITLAISCVWVKAISSILLKREKISIC